MTPRKKKGSGSKLPAEAAKSREEKRKQQPAEEPGRQQLAAVVDASEDAILLLTPDGVITDWNPAAERIYGYSRRQAVGKNVDFLAPPDRVGEIGELILRLRRGKKIHNRQTTRRCRDGRELFIVLTLSAVMGDSGEITAVSSIERDVTARHQRERQMNEVHEQLQIAARAAGLGVWNYDLQRGTTQWNEQLYLLLGLQPRDGPEDGQRFFEFIHPEDRGGSIQNLQAILRMQEDDIDEEFRVIRTDGKIRWLASRGRIYRDRRGRPVRISGINFDITDRKQDEETVRLAQVQLATQLSETVRVNEELSQYAYAVSHDLKGPLRAIRNYVDFLSEDLAGTLTGDQKKYLEGLKTAVKQGDALIEDLLSFSRLDAVPLEPEPVEMPGLVDEVCLLLDLPAEVQIDAETKWPHFTVDRTLLKQILQNLVSNAVKFNRRTAKRIEIGWQPAPGDRIEIFVRDNGIGIEPQYREQVFRIFQRLHTDKDYEGTGIGLAIVQKAAQKLGGSVRLESEPGTGSTFFVALPRGGIDQRQPPVSRDRASANFAPDD